MYQFLQKNNLNKLGFKLNKRYKAQLKLFFIFVFNFKSEAKIYILIILHFYMYKKKNFYILYSLIN